MENAIIPHANMAAVSMTAHFIGFCISSCMYTLYTYVNTPLYVAIRAIIVIIIRFLSFMFLVLVLSLYWLSEYYSVKWYLYRMYFDTDPYIFRQWLIYILFLCVLSEYYSVIVFIVCPYITYIYKV